jgi:hypothetical protein
MQYLADMLKVAFGANVGHALLCGERFAEAHLNRWNEALGYMSVALVLDGP